ncbi:hypothetical protein R1sor_023205 [Riccia sorocarpa]|uniref:Telomerase reverse transcriptase n=1 Tax=Riccia sorocarpa TaxID=122646 RepID=A0ABD3GP81_9MARC
MHTFSELFPEEQGKRCGSGNTEDEVYSVSNDTAHLVRSTPWLEQEAAGAESVATGAEAQEMVRRKQLVLQRKPRSVHMLLKKRLVKEKRCAYARCSVFTVHCLTAAATRFPESQVRFLCKMDRGVPRPSPKQETDCYKQDTDDLSPEVEDVMKLFWVLCIACAGDACKQGFRDFKHEKDLAMGGFMRPTFESNLTPPSIDLLKAGARISRKSVKRVIYRHSCEDLPIILQMKGSRAVTSVTPVLASVRVFHGRTPTRACDRLSFCQLVPHLTAKHSHSTFTDQGSCSFVRKEKILALLEGLLERNTIQMGKQFYHQTVGVPQGSTILSILCSLFYGHFVLRRLMPDRSSCLTDRLSLTSNLTRGLKSYCDLQLPQAENLAVVTREANVEHMLE